MTISRFLFTWAIILLLSISNNGFSQTQIAGRVIDTKNQNPLSFVNIGIKNKNTGTISRDDGSFVISIPSEFTNDTLTFSLVGYYELNLLITELVSGKEIIIQLKEKTIPLTEVVITGEKSVEKKYGIKRRGTIHFTDGIFKKDDSFEIGQVIKPGNSIVQITSLNLHINSSRPDSATFRINFYRYDDVENIPKERIIEKSILQRHPVKEGWLKFDLSDNPVLIKGNVLVAIEFIPESKKDIKQLFYEVKLGGSSKSFFRKTSLGQWARPPHHYCLYVTALTDKHAPNEIEDEETLPAFSLKSDFSSEPFNFFVKVPKSYSKNAKQLYPVVYLLDGNAYFDPVADYVGRFAKQRKVLTEPILVGIGYENAYVMDSLRSRDYTFPVASPEDSFRLSGKGDQFYDFIKSKVIPHVDMNYRTDTTNRTIMGHSLGGYFVLYALLRQLAEPPVFNNFVAASPSIYYNDYYLIKEMKDRVKDKSATKDVSLFMTIGELENADKESLRFADLYEIMKADRVDTYSEVYKNFGHMETAIPTFEDGIQLLFDKKKTNRQ